MELLIQVLNNRINELRALLKLPIYNSLTIKKVEAKANAFTGAYKNVEWSVEFIFNRNTTTLLSTSYSGLLTDSTRPRIERELELKIIDLIITLISNPIAMNELINFTYGLIQ